MSKIGRNDPCHCGSGKKYKKCCADKDEQSAVEVKTESITKDIFNESNWEDKPQEDPYPTITKEEEQLVDEWWNIYKKIDSLDEERQHLDSFLNNYPHLAENLGLEHEVLYELGAEYRRQQRTDEYIAFLIDFRKRFPLVFKRSAGHYDSDIMGWLITQGRTNEIKYYLNYFIDNPVKFADQLHNLVYLLAATDVTGEVVPLITKVGQRLMESDELIYGEDTNRYLLINSLSPYIKSDFTKSDIREFTNDLSRDIPYKIEDNENIVAIWPGKVQSITRPFVRWPETVPARKTELRKQYSEITLNFIRYMHEEVRVSWISAQYYADLVHEYLETYLDRNDRLPKHLFFFPKSQMEHLLFDMTQEMAIYVNCTKLLGLLNGLYFFAGYLNQCNNLTDEETTRMQEDCKSIYTELYPALSRHYFEASCFSTFPVLGSE